MEQEAEIIPLDYSWQSFADMLKAVVHDNKLYGFFCVSSTITGKMVPVPDKNFHYVRLNNRYEVSICQDDSLDDLLTWIKDWVKTSRPDAAEYVLFKMDPQWL